MSFLLKLISYIGPITIHKCESEISGTLDVRWEKGRLALNSPGANYSFNALHKVLQKALRQVDINIPSDGQILNLGMGAGSSLAILREELKLKQRIVSVEIDPLVIELADSFFEVGRHARHDIINEDAASFMSRNKETFNLILVDLFIDRIVPNRFTTQLFINQLTSALEPGGKMVLNHMSTEGENNYLSFFESIDGEVTQHEFNQAENNILIYSAPSQSN